MRLIQVQMTVMVSYPLKKYYKLSFYMKEFHNFRNWLLQKVFVARFLLQKVLATKSFFITGSISYVNDCGDFLPHQESLQLLFLQERISQISKTSATKTFCSKSNIV
jgi:hypothetical protein